RSFSESESDRRADTEDASPARCILTAPGCCPAAEAPRLDLGVNGRFHRRPAARKPSPGGWDMGKFLNCPPQMQSIRSAPDIGIAVALLDKTKARESPLEARFFPAGSAVLPPARPARRMRRSRAGSSHPQELPRERAATGSTPLWIRPPTASCIQPMTSSPRYESRLAPCRRKHRIAQARLPSTPVLPAHWPGRSAISTARPRAPQRPADSAAEDHPRKPRGDSLEWRWREPAVPAWSGRKRLRPTTPAPDLGGDLMRAATRQTIESPSAARRGSAGVQLGACKSPDGDVRLAGACPLPLPSTCPREYSIQMFSMQCRADIEAKRQ